MYNKAFHIVVNPPGSKFAKALQAALKDVVNNKVFRRRTPKQGRSYFAITPQALNKIEQFTAFKNHGISCPGFTVDKNAVKELAGKVVFARTLINSTNGKGIIEFEKEQEEIPHAPLYVEYIPKKTEYRFHVFGEGVIDVQEKKKRRNNAADGAYRIRNLDNGYVYCRNDVNPPPAAADLAIRAVKACGYQYGAVDVIYNEKKDTCYVLEVNSRPGLMGTTLEKYRDAIINHYNLERK